MIDKSFWQEVFELSALLIVTAIYVCIVLGIGYFVDLWFGSIGFIVYLVCAMFLTMILTVYAARRS